MQALGHSSAVSRAAPPLRRDASARRGVARARLSCRAEGDDASSLGDAAATSSARASTPPSPASMSRRRLINLTAATTALVVSSASAPSARAGEFGSDAAMAIVRREGKVRKTEAEWRAMLADDGYAFDVLRKEATERPFSSPLNTEKREGTFICAGCGSALFASSAKYDSGTGWPSFVAPIAADAVTEVPDYSIVFLPRTEVRCATCQGHLGHVFDDGPRDRTGLRYCMNGAAMKFQPA